MNNISENPTWFFGEERTTKLAKQAMLSSIPVEEITLSHVYLEVDWNEDCLEVYLYNTDPKNWNLFMFPYETRKIRRKIEGSEIVNVMDSEVKLFEKFDLPKSNGSNSGISTQCEVKFSQSTNRQTLYIFVYDIVKPNTKSFEFEQLKLSFFGLEELSKYFDDNSSKFASNVPGIIKKIWELHRT
jgi:hypothetical protein